MVHQDTVIDAPRVCTYVRHAMMESAVNLATPQSIGLWIQLIQFVYRMMAFAMT
jgi:hypothetical protein